jgi:hypothetical protein
MLLEMRKCRHIKQQLFEGTDPEAGHMARAEAPSTAEKGNSTHPGCCH